MHSHSMPSTVARRRLDLADFDAVIAEAKRLRDTNYERAGNWDLSQICQHLAAAIHGSIDGTDKKSPLLERLVARFFIKDALLRSRRIRAGVESPIEGLVFESTGDATKSIDDFIAAIDRFIKYQGECGSHPLFGKLTREEWAQFHVIHASHHFGFLVPREK